MEITRTSSITGRTTTMDLPVTTEQIQRWQDGELIQNAMPHLDSAQREFLKSGITAGEWDVFFAPEEEEDY